MHFQNLPSAIELTSALIFRDILIILFVIKHRLKFTYAIAISKVVLVFRKCHQCYNIRHTTISTKDYWPPTTVQRSDHRPLYNVLTNDHYTTFLEPTNHCNDTNVYTHFRAASDTLQLIITCHFLFVVNVYPWKAHYSSVVNGWTRVTCVYILIKSFIRWFSLMNKCPLHAQLYHYLLNIESRHTFSTL